MNNKSNITGYLFSTMTKLIMLLVLRGVEQELCTEDMHQKILIFI